MLTRGLARCLVELMLRYRRIAVAVGLALVLVLLLVALFSGCQPSAPPSGAQDSPNATARATSAALTTKTPTFSFFPPTATPGGGSARAPSATARRSASPTATSRAVARATATPTARASESATRTAPAYDQPCRLAQADPPDDGRTPADRVIREYTVGGREIILEYGRGNDRSGDYGWSHIRNKHLYGIWSGGGIVSTFSEIGVCTESGVLDVIGRAIAQGRQQSQANSRVLFTWPVPGARYDVLVVVGSDGTIITSYPARR